jgi:uncharacterized membrane protein YsdA (DUF1294 family)
MAWDRTYWIYVPLALWITASTYDQLAQNGYLATIIHRRHTKWIVSTSITNLVLFFVDKLMAILSSRWRVPEALFHTLSLLGGFSGAWLGRRLFRHKTRKSVFGQVLLAGLLLHCCLWKLGV